MTRTGKWTLAVISAGAILLAAAIVLDDLVLSKHTVQVWDLGVKTVGGVAVILGGGKYLVDRANAIRWDKARFLVELYRDFDSSKSRQKAKRLIDHATYNNDEQYLERILSDPLLLTEDEKADRDSVDTYLDFFDRIYAFVFMNGSLSKDDVASFWGYPMQVAQLSSVKRYCLEWGYEDVLRLAGAFADSANEREKVIAELKV